MRTSSRACWLSFVDWLGCGVSGGPGQTLRRASGSRPAGNRKRLDARLGQAGRAVTTRQHGQLCSWVHPFHYLRYRRTIRRRWRCLNCGYRWLA